MSDQWSQWNSPRPDFAYEVSDERLIAYSRIPLIDRLHWLDDVRRFTLMLRDAPTVTHEDATAKNNPTRAR